MDAIFDNITQVSVQVPYSVTLPFFKPILENVIFSSVTPQDTEIQGSPTDGYSDT